MNTKAKTKDKIYLSLSICKSKQADNTGGGGYSLILLHFFYSANKCDCRVIYGQHTCKYMIVWFPETMDHITDVPLYHVKSINNVVEINIT